MSEVWAIVVAGGSGSRFAAGVPKQFLPLGGSRLVDRALAAAGAACQGVVVVLPAAHLDAALPAGVARVAGGATRSGSVRAGLAAVPEDAEVIVVHDAARPLAGPALFERVVAAVRAGADGAVPGIPVADTIKRVDPAEGTVVGTLDRPALRAAQTPQAFAAATLRRAHAGGAEATDDAALVEAMGGRVVVVEGDPANLKVTGPDDLVRAEALLTTGPVIPQGRVGQGFDIHPWSDDQDRPLVLGGVILPGERGLAGHSDADVVAHAVADALLGAAGLGDIGTHFPDTDPRWGGSDSLRLLEQVAGLVRAEGWSIGNVDTTVILEAPKLADHRAAMEQRLSGAVGAAVSVKAKRAEGLGSLGRGEGVACLAATLLWR